MPISQTDQVFRLVKSLSKSEKRNFKLYAGRIQDKEELLYIKLFDLMDKQKVLDEREVLDKMGKINATQYSNMKRHLYSQILVSLRHLYKEKQAFVKVREYIDQAYILYNKGLYMPALKILDKAKKLSFKHHTDFSSLTIVEIEKMIQSRHITRTNTASIEALVEQADILAHTSLNRTKLSNLKVQLHRYYIKKGHVNNEAEEQEVIDFFDNNLPTFEEANLGMMERIYLYQCYVWYYYILEDFKGCYDYALKWIDLFDHSEELMQRDLDLYMRGYHYVLTAAYNLKMVPEYIKHLKTFDNFRKQNYNSFNENSKIMSFLYVHTGRMNGHFLQGTFDMGVSEIPRTLRRMKRYAFNLDEHKIMILNFKMAWMYLGNAMPKKANEYLIKIINLSSKTLRKDMQIYARLMHLMVNFDLDGFDIMPYLTKTYEKYITSEPNTNQVQLQTLDMFKKLSKAALFDRKKILSTYHASLSEVKAYHFSKRAFLYLDVLIWIESKLADKSIKDLTKQLNH